MMDRRSFFRGAAAVFAVSAGMAALPAHAAKGTVALLPATVTVGRAQNGVVVTNALRASLEKQGFTVLPLGNVQSQLQAQGLAGQRILSDAQLAGVRDALGVDFLVYPRVLSVGVGIGTPQQFQANILVNVQGKTGKSFIHTRQVGQVFDPRGASRDTAVIGRAEADTAAAKLMEAFYAKTGK